MGCCQDTEKCKQCCQSGIYTSIYLGIIESVVFAVLKVVFGVISGSHALVAASLYSLQDLISSIVAVGGLAVSARPPDNRHPYGYGKIEYLVVAVTSLLILIGLIVVVLATVGSIFGIADSSMVNGSPTWLALMVSVLCLSCCWLLAGYQRCVGEKINSPAILSCSSHMDADVISSLAVAVSVIGSKLGYPELDQACAILESMHIVFLSGSMLATAIAGLLDRAADDKLLSEIRAASGSVESVKEVSDVVAHWAGQLLVARVDVRVAASMKLVDAEKIRSGIVSEVKKSVYEQSDISVRLLPWGEEAAEVVVSEEKGVLRSIRALTGRLATVGRV